MVLSLSTTSSCTTTSGRFNASIRALAFLCATKMAPKSLNGCPPGDVVEMTVAVDHVFNRRLGDLLDFLDIGLRRRPPQANGIGSDHTFRRHDEHRLMADVAEDVDIVAAVDFGGCEKRRRLRARGEWPCRGGADEREGLTTVHG